MKRATLLILLFSFLSFTFAQVSLWQDHNPFSEELKPGDLVELDINETFDISIDSSWDNSQKLEMKLYPDNKNFSFLKNSEQSRKSARKAEVKYKIKESLKFSLMAQVSESASDGDKTFNITGEKNLIVDDKPIRLRVTGLAHKNSVFKGKLASKDMANFSMTILAKAPLASDNTIVGKDDLSGPDSLSDQEKRNLILKHIQEILGYFKQ